MITNKNILLAVGQISLAVSILLHFFVGESGPVSFTAGFLTGLSLVFNTTFLLIYRKEKSSTV